MSVLIFIVVLSFLVFIHELGHYLAARHVGVRVQKFSIGFPPKMFGKKVGDTEYVLSWIPLGGYVKLEGQNLDDENPNDPANYAAKTRLQRLYILLAGPAMNLVVAVCLLPVVFMLGQEVPTYQQQPARVESVQAGSIASQSGFRAGDHVLMVNQQVVNSWRAFRQTLIQQAVEQSLIPVLVSNGGQQRTVEMPASSVLSDKPLGLTPWIAPLIGKVYPNTAAELAGLQAGDKITAIDNTPVTSWVQLVTTLQQFKEPRSTQVSIERGTLSKIITITPQKDPESGRLLLGIGQATSLVRAAPVAAIERGLQTFWQTTRMTLIFVGKMVTGQGSWETLGGPVKIGGALGNAAQEGWATLLSLTALISLQLGIFNLLPIPALDGGHITMLGLEWLKGKPLSSVFRMRTQVVGMSMLLVLMVAVTWKDVLDLLS